MTALRGAFARRIPTRRGRLLWRAAAPALVLALAGTAPAGTALAGTAPAGTALAGTAPAGTAPAGTAVYATAPGAPAPEAVIAAAVKARAASCVAAPLGPGARGNPVTYLQLLLNFGGYWQGDVNGSYTELTKQAVMAVQATHGLQVDGYMGPATWLALCSQGRPAPRTRYGLVLEVDKRRQVILVARDGRTIWVLHTSTGGNYSYNAGRSYARTPEGHFAVYQRVNGWQHGQLGTLYRPAYVVGGVAIHGGYAVPPYPASHGCIRQTNQAMDLLWAGGYVSIGTSVWIYS